MRGKFPRSFCVLNIINLNVNFVLKTLCIHQECLPPPPPLEPPPPPLGAVLDAPPRMLRDILPMLRLPPVLPPRLDALLPVALLIEARVPELLPPMLLP